MYGVYDVPTDGNCLFSAVSLAYALEKKIHCSPSTLRRMSRELRTRAVNILSDTEAMYDDLPLSTLIETDDKESYCNRMRQSETWGSVTEIIAISKVLQRPIHVHAHFGVERYGHGEDDPLCIRYADHHYQTLHKLSHDRSKIALGVCLVIMGIIAIQN